MTTYSERLKDPRWQKRRLQILSRADFSCEECGANDKTLHVHHRLYRKGAMPWEYADSELQSLCFECHEKVTHVRERLDEAIAELDPARIEELLGCADALVAKDFVFCDAIQKQDNGIRAWRLISHQHARGFALCLSSGIQPELVSAVLDAQPIFNEGVEMIADGRFDLLKAK